MNFRMAESVGKDKTKPSVIREKCTHTTNNLLFTELSISCGQQIGSRAAGFMRLLTRFNYISPVLLSPGNVCGARIIHGAWFTFICHMSGNLSSTVHTAKLICIETIGLCIKLTSGINLSNIYYTFMFIKGTSLLLYETYVTTYR